MESETHLLLKDLAVLGGLAVTALTSVIGLLTWSIRARMARDAAARKAEADEQRQFRQDFHEQIVTLTQANDLLRRDRDDYRTEAVALRQELNALRERLAVLEAKAESERRRSTQQIEVLNARIADANAQAEARVKEKQARISALEQDLAQVHAELQDLRAQIPAR